MPDRAFDAFLNAPSGLLDSPHGDAVRAAYRLGGMRGYWRQRLAMLQRQSKEHYVSPYAFAVSDARMGEGDKAMESLEKAFNERYPSIVFVQIEPVFDKLRSDPRFADLVRRINAFQR
jgi:hypothetical protein